MWWHRSQVLPPPFRTGLCPVRFLPRPTSMSMLCVFWQDNCYFWLEPPNNCLTILTILDPMTRQTGCLRYVPHSHRESRCRPHVGRGTLGFSQEVADYSAADRASEVCSITAHLYAARRENADPSAHLAGGARLPQARWTCD